MQTVTITSDGLKSKLTNGEVKFTYTKIDGTLREARGTTKLDMIPEDLHPKTPGNAHVAYFDLDKNEWRSVAEGQKITMSSDDLMYPYEKPNLTEEEITLMLFVFGHLEDKWMCNLINLIMSATKQRAIDLSLAFKNLVRVCREYENDVKYATELRNKWIKLINE